MIITEEVKVLPTKRINTINEDELLRNLLYVFQDIDGNLISYSHIDEVYSITPSVVITEGTREIILELCELGWFYKKIINYLYKHTHNIHEGQVVQSFCSAIQTELNEYFRLLTILEKQVQGNPTKTNDKKLDIVKLYVWMQDTIQKMKYIAIICDTSQSKL
jgi:gamma-tubulin complex component 3